ncbi:coiled-coil domain-containing protein 97 [Ochlerotatus camptorhynchus]|uniref:coiled-coil domain-containing protein 97 n=1 Tax=Ochlerotatus camptorhynchus TaxID=644619 RepID=UPI0031D49736
MTMQDPITNGDTPASAPVQDALEPVLEADLIDHICRDPKVFYKSQQINDPELTTGEKLQIVKQVLEKSHTTFLARFGNFIKENHLRFFEQEQQTSCYSPDERYEVDYYLSKIRKSHHGGREQEVRNRRYAALKQLVHEGNYFKETEMMQREPLLYDQLVGQYLTEQEKKARDAAGTKNDSLVAILFNGMDKENTESLKKEQESEEKQQDEPDEDEHSYKEKPPDSPGFSRAQWGNFDLEEEERQKNVQQEREAKQRNKKFSIPVNLMTAGERDLLRDEFLGTMYSKFISGEDAEFDYSKVDESMEYDNLDILEQDEQERYFDTEDSRDGVLRNEDDDGGEMQQDDSEEDDLDVYMRHLNQHLENQKNMDHMNNQMRDVNCQYDSDE